MHPEIADVLAGRRRWCVPVGDCLDVLASMPDGCARCCVTSPPYWGLRDYGVDGQLGLESTPEEYVANMVAVFREVRRVLADDATAWVNLGDSYVAGGERATGRNDTDRETPGGRGGSFRGGERRKTGQRGGLKPKNLVGIPWRVAFALQADGWWLRQDIIWHKPNPMPESVTDRCTKAHEYVFLLAKAERYFYNAEAIKERGAGGGRFNGAPGGQPCPDRGDNARQDMTPTENRNKRSVWTVTPEPFPEAHFATYPPKLIEPCILAGSEVGDLIIDPFNGAGTTGLVSVKHGRRYVGPDLNPAYADIARRRIAEADTHLFNTSNEGSMNNA
jgi:DNA modification methylase